MMVRDMDFVREILLKIEDMQSGMPIKSSDFDSYGRNSITYHANLLNQAGFLSEFNAFPEMEFNEITGDWSKNNLLFSVNGLTWEGHDFLDKIRDENIWNKTKGIAKTKGIPLVIGTITVIATTIIS